MGEEKNICIYVLYVNNYDFDDFNFKRVDSRTEVEYQRKHYPFYFENKYLEKNVKNGKYPWIYVGYSDTLHSLEKVKAGKRNVYTKYLKKERNWAPWMKLYSVEGNKKINIHELEIIPSENFETRMEFYITEYTRLYPGCVLNDYKIDKGCQTDMNYDPKIVIKNRKMGCRLIPKDKNTIQREYRERNRELLNEKGKMYYKKRKEKEGHGNPPENILTESSMNPENL